MNSESVIIAEINKLIKNIESMPCFGVEPVVMGIYDKLKSIKANDKEIEWDSQAIIGRVKERNRELSGKGFHWSSFYNGWLEGRVDMLRQCKFNPPDNKAEAIAFAEWIQIKGYIQSSNDLWYLNSDGNPSEGITIELLYAIYKDDTKGRLINKILDNKNPFKD